MDERDRWFRRDSLRDLDRGWAISAELLTATAVWGGIGWLLDRWLGSDPWLFAVGVLVGFSLGTYLVFKRHEEVARREDGKRARL
jgi:F0F1-type ATP synthase assembly protein I